MAVLVFFSVGGRSAEAQSGKWVWQNGNSVYEATSVTGVYGVLGTGAPGNTPSGRNASTTWTDSAGNLWLFGGAPDGSLLTAGPSRNDLWRFDPTVSEWTWVSGASSDNAPLPGVYGQLRVASPANNPGSRAGGVGWVDGSDNLWLFGGSGYDSLGNLGGLDDLWKFDPTTAEWTWMGGDATIPATAGECVPGAYGTLGTASASNLPGGRAYAGAWTDSSGTFWLFGGDGCGGSGGQALLNDLWSYSPTTGQWTWEGGSTSGYTAGVYGTLGVEDNSNVPGSRYMFASWTDAAGEFWMFGGFGLDVSAALGSLNDLWRFDPSTRQWAWISGNSSVGVQNCSATLGLVGCSRSGVYGSLGVPSAGNVPGGRVFAVGAAVSNGRFLLFGGSNAAGNVDQSSRYINDLDDLWQFDPVTAQWTWSGGSDAMVCGGSSQGACFVDGQAGVYGMEGAADTANFPGSREGQVRWTDNAGNFWIFGGDGFDSAGLDSQLNDMWEYRVPPAAVQVAATVTLTSSGNPAFTQNPIAFTAHVSSGAGAGAAVPTGTVAFSEGDVNNAAMVQIGSAKLNGAGNATLPVSSLPTGTFTITATYSGDANNLAATGTATEAVGDFSLAANAPTKATVSSGGMATYILTLTPVGPISAFPAAIALTASGGPAGAIYAFAPASVASGSSATNATLTVTVPAQPASATSGLQWPSAPAVPLFVGAMLWPFVRRGRRDREQGRGARLMGRGSPAALLMLVGGLGAALALSGCGNSFYIRATSPSQPIPTAPPPYSITVTGSSGGLSQSATVTLVVN